MTSTATSAAAAVAPAAASSAEYVNYMDIKLEGVHRVPPDWLSAGFPVPAIGTTGGPAVSGSSHAHAHGKEPPVEEPEVAYAYHPFRYEVTLALPATTTASAAVTASTAAASTAATSVSGGDTAADIASAEPVSEPPSLSTGDQAAAPGTCVVASFLHGRLLVPLPQYTAYIAAAEPPPAPGVDDASPLRDVPAAIGAEDVLAASGQDRAAREAGKAVDKAAAPAASATPSAPPAAAPSILWVMTERTSAPGAGAAAASVETSAPTTAKRRGKSTTAVAAAAAAAGGAAAAAAAAAASSAAAAAAAAAAAVPGAPPPPLPDASEPAPCVVRVPLTAAQETYLEGLLESGTPLKLTFRRVLRPGCPAEWEDFNAGYFEADIPVSLHALTEPGSTHLAAEVPLQPAMAPEKRTAAGAATADSTDLAERGKKRSVTRKQRQLVPSTLIDGPDRDAPHPYVAVGTAASVSITLQRTLTRLVSDRVRPAVTPAQLIPPRPTPTASMAAADDVQTRLQQTLREIVRRLVRDMRSSSAKGVPGSGAAAGSDSAAWRAELVSALQATGELAAFKSQLTPLVTGLVQERLRSDPASGGSQQEVARASTELYVQLMDMLHSTMHECVIDAAAGVGGGAAAGGEERELRWRAIEAEVSGDAELAAKLYQSRLATHVAGDSWAALWVDCALFYQRTEALAKAEQCYREAIACDPGCTVALLDYGAWLLAHDRLDEAAVFLHGLVDVAPQHTLGWGCIALLADLHELAIRVGSPDAAAEQKKWRREQRLALRRAVECGAASPAAHGGGGVSATPPPPPSLLSPQQDGEEEQMYFDVATYLVHLHHRDLANLCLARCRPGEPRVELLYALLFTQGGQYEEALKTLDGVQTPSVAYAAASAAGQRLVDECALLRAECAAALGRPSDAVRMYKQALCRGAPAAAPPYLALLASRWQQQRQEAQLASVAGRGGVLSSASALLDRRLTEAGGMFYLSAYLRLCNLLLAEGRYRDALGVATLALQVWPSSSVLWLGAGVAYYRAGDLVPAEECLQESNTLNPANPRTWAYLALLAARLQNVGVEEVVQQLLSLNLEDAPLWAELGRTLLGTAQYSRLSVLCLRRAVSLVDGKGSSSAAVQASTQYHLAHALMDLQQWGEAEQLLASVAARGGGNEVLRGKAEEELALLRAGGQ
ncbi:TPR repeat [Novymonas esmeraldas]|uniref:TPR repeat n=1 Tax=Novymonas esmeraldas TaxID=1808958 RepID=A0AAW0F1V5_9TRYP